MGGNWVFGYGRDTVYTLTVVAGAVGRVDENLQRFRQVSRVLKLFIFVRLDVVGDAEVTHAVPGGPGGEQRADSGGVRVAHAAARARLGSGIRCHSRRKVVGLRCEKQVEVDGPWGQRGRPARACGPQRGVDEAADGG